LDVDPVTKEQTWKFVDGIGADLRLTSLTPDSGPKKGDQVRVVTFTITVASNDINGFTQVWDGISPDPDHQQAGSPDGLTKKFGARPSNLQQARSLPIVITLGENIDDGLKVLQAIFNSQPMLRAAIDKRGASDAERSIDIDLQGGNDGMRPRAGEYEGNEDPNTTTKTGLKSFEDLEDISTVAAPGSTYGLANGYRSDGSQIINNLISHATRMRYRIAVLDSGDGQSISAVRTLRGNIESSYAALYYPWVRILDPVTCEEIHLPPSGFVAGIYARNDAHRGGIERQRMKSSISPSASNSS
jgi:hypothetical protein